MQPTLAPRTMKTLIVICLGLLLAGCSNGQELKTDTEKGQQSKASDESKPAIRPQDGRWRFATNEFTLEFEVANSGTVVTNFSAYVHHSVSGGSPGLLEASGITNGKFTATNNACAIRGHFIGSTVATGTVVVAFSVPAGFGRLMPEEFRHSGPWVAQLKPSKQ